MKKIETTKKSIEIIPLSKLIIPILLLIGGILLIFQADATIKSISYIIGAILLLIGLVGVIGFLKDQDNSMLLVYGIVSIVSAILLILNPEFIATIIPFIIGILIIISSAFKLQKAIDLKNFGVSLTTPIIIAILEMICGLLIVFNPFGTVITIVKLVGIFLSVYALLDIINILNLKSQTKKTRIKEAEIKEEEEE